MRVIAYTALAAALALSACASKPPPAAEGPSGPATPSGPEGPRAGTAEDFRVSVGDRVFFQLDSSELSGEARAILQRQAQWLQRYPNVQVLVAGNADERGTREYNLALGARRANAARDYLASLGVPAGRMQTISYGKERPLDPRTSEEGWAINRNAHTQIVSGAVS
jgi:peptidoglycan-associated lipoprotein